MEKINEKTAAGNGKSTIQKLTGREKFERDQKREARQRNYEILRSSVVKTMQDKAGKFNIDHVLASEIAWDLTKQPPGDVVLYRPTKTLKRNGELIDDYERIGLFRHEDFSWQSGHTAFWLIMIGSFVALGTFYWLLFG